jgi:hypothetical protein
MSCATTADSLVITVIIGEISPVIRLSTLNISPYLRHHIREVARLPLSALCLTTLPLVTELVTLSGISGECGLLAQASYQKEITAEP